MTPCRRRPALLPPCCCALLLFFFFFNSSVFRRWELRGAPSMPGHCICSHALSPCPPLPPSPRLVHAAQPRLHPSRSPAKLFPPALQVFPARLPPPRLACPCSDRLLACSPARQPPAPPSRCVHQSFPPGPGQPSPLLHRLRAPLPVLLNTTHLRNARGPQIPQHAYHAAAALCRHSERVLAVVCRRCICPRCSAVIMYAARHLRSGLTLR